ncbi:hypothetical protein AERO8C_20652 [Aeromonas veronii]|uniref:Uncharacterized protein n=1 Tax=Aeromonas veronii TaxID=654 RepID=A0A653L481_AERVE|nr:hypothetical protein AERO8C_20652 [Aeromonas veronii]
MAVLPNKGGSSACDRRAKRSDNILLVSNLLIFYRFLPDGSFTLPLSRLICLTWQPLLQR